MSCNCDQQAVYSDKWECPEHGVVTAQETPQEPQAGHEHAWRVRLPSGDVFDDFEVGCATCMADPLAKAAQADALVKVLRGHLPQCGVCGAMPTVEDTRPYELTEYRCAAHASDFANPTPLHHQDAAAWNLLPDAAKGATTEPSYVEVRGTACHAGSDGDCSWADCPQLKDYQIYCPLAKGAIT